MLCIGVGWSGPLRISILPCRILFKSLERCLRKYFHSHSTGEQPEFKFRTEPSDSQFPVFDGLKFRLCGSVSAGRGGCGFRFFEAASFSKPWERCFRSFPTAAPRLSIQNFRFPTKSSDSQFLDFRRFNFLCSGSVWGWSRLVQISISGCPILSNPWKRCFPKLTTTTTRLSIQNSRFPTKSSDSQFSFF